MGDTEDFIISTIVVAGVLGANPWKGPFFGWVML